MQKGKQRVKNFFMKRVKWEVYVFILLGMSLIPLIWIGKYNVMAADDYVGKNIHFIWQETNNFWNVIAGAMQNTIKDYLTWQGSFTYTFLYNLNPALKSESLAWVTPVVMIGMVLISVFFLTRAFLTRYYDIDKGEILILSAMFCFLILQTFVSPVEGLYWYSGAVAYTFLHFFMLLFWGILFVAEKQQNRTKKILLICVGVIFAFFVGGSQYITALQCVMGYGIYLIIALKKGHRWKILPGIFLTVGFAMNIFAPGNFVRRGHTTGMSPLRAIFQSFILAVDYVKEWVSPLFIVVICFLLPFIWKIVCKQKKEYKYKYPLLILLGSYCMYASAFTPALYGVGNVTSGRIQNLIQVVFYVFVFIDLFYFIGWIQRRMKSDKEGLFKDINDIKNIVQKYEVGYMWLAFLGIVLVLAGTGDRNTYSSVSALRSLALGEAQTYYYESQERLQVFENASIEVAEIKPFSVKPHVLFFNDIAPEESENDWINKSVAEYYKKDKVVLIKENPDF